MNHDAKYLFTQNIATGRDCLIREYFVHIVSCGLENHWILNFSKSKLREF